MNISEGDLLWEPSQHFADSSHLARYTTWLKDKHGQSFENYDALWRWSVSDIEAFWRSIWDYFDVQADGDANTVLSDRTMPGAKWFPDTRLNYAEHLLRHEVTAPDAVVFKHLSEIRPLAHMSWAELGDQVRRLATQLRALGINEGDRVVSYMPNIPETAIAMLATTAIGAIWSSAAPEFGVGTVVDRFAQIEPKLLFAADGYRFGGKDFDRRDQIEQIRQAIPSLETTVWLPYLDLDAAGPDNSLDWHKLIDIPAISRDAFQFNRVATDHPLWILFSSGTTGLPKAIVAGHGGAVLEHFKALHLQMNIGPDSTMFFYSTTGWIMWNILLGALITGGAVVLYDGHPAYPTEDFLWKLAADTEVTSFGASPTFIQLMEKAGLQPGEAHDLSHLNAMVLSGAPASPEIFEWIYRSVKSELWMSSISGGTEILSAFVGGAPTLPVRAGEIQCRCLGLDIQAWGDDGEELPADEVGELIVTQPFPSMPVKFWADAAGQKYHDAYFADFPGVWRHGDFIKINSRGGCYIYGRSDSTLNRNGIRIGTSEIYRVVEQIGGVQDSLIICRSKENGEFHMPLFLQLKAGVELSNEIIQSINSALRQQCSPRHVPDEIIAIPKIPYTLTGKKMEIPVRKLLDGQPLAKAANPDAMQDPRALDYFIELAKSPT